MSEIAWIGSIMGIGGLIGTLIVGWLADFAGRKNSLLLMAVPQIVRIYPLSISSTRTHLLKMLNVTFFFFFSFLCSIHFIFNASNAITSTR